MFSDKSADTRHPWRSHRAGPARRLVCLFQLKFSAFVAPLPTLKTMVLNQAEQVPLKATPTSSSCFGGSSLGDFHRITQMTGILGADFHEATKECACSSFAVASLDTLNRLPTKNGTQSNFGGPPIEMKTPIFSPHGYDT